MRIRNRNLALLFGAILGVGQASAQSTLEIPQPGSTQSGISIVSGWHCDATRVEVSFNGGQRIAVAYGTTRNDTMSVCGDDNNGFSLLWAYSLLGAGEHEVVAYADGVEFGRATFKVTDIANRQFVRNKSEEVRATTFPDLAHDVILKWQEANQNFVMSDYISSRDTYDVAGIWRMYDGASVDYQLTINVADFENDPEAARLAGMMSNFSNRTYLFGGSLRGNYALIIMDPASGADFTGKFNLQFSSQTLGSAELVSCSPSYRCPVPVGTILPLDKVWPVPVKPELTSAASSLKATDSADADADQPIRSIQDAALEELKMMVE